MAAVYWHSDSQTSVIINMRCNSQWKAFHDAVAQAHKLSTTVLHKVDLIVMVPEKMPEGNLIAQFSRVCRNQPDNIASVIIVPPVTGASQALQLAIRLSLITNLLFPHKSHVVFVKSPEAALSYTTVSS